MTQDIGDQFDQESSYESSAPIPESELGDWESARSRFSDRVRAASARPNPNRTSIDYGTTIGIVAAFGLMGVAIIFGGGVLLFFDLPSFLIVIGGTIGATLINFPLDDFRRTSAVMRNAFFPDLSSAQIRMRKIIALARRAKIAGRLSLQTDIYRETDPFLKKSIELLIDDLPADQVRNILELELASLEDRHRRGAQLFQAMGTIAPAMGLIGTLIGLVQMLQHLQDPSQVGGGMAVALLTTFYGAVLAYLVFLPVAGKLRTRSEEELRLKELTIEGIVCMVQGVNPRIIEQYLLSYLPPDSRYSEY